MKLSCFPPKKTGLLLAELASLPIRFEAGNSLNSCSNSRSQKKTAFSNVIIIFSLLIIIDMVKLLLKNNADYNAQAKNGLAAIHLCAQEDRINVAEILAAKGADLNAVTKAGYSPLHVATHFGSISIVKYLLDQQVEVSGQNELGYTPLHQAAQQGHSQIVNLLLETGRASPNTVSNVSIIFLIFFYI